MNGFLSPGGGLLNFQQYNDFYNNMVNSNVTA